MGTILSLFLGVPSWIKSTLLGGVALLVVGGLVYHSGDVHGRAAVQARWDSAAKATLALGEQARATAEQKIPGIGGVPDVAPGGKPCIVYDRFNRDCKAKPVRAK